MNLKRISGLIFVVLISILPLVNLLTPGLPITHDGLDHVVRIANFYKSLSEGVIIPRWAGGLNWGYGHPILMFLYPLPSYSASFFHLLGLSFVDSFKLLFASSFVLSGIFMYLWLKEFLGEKAAIVGASLYLFAPYRFIDLYVRGAIGEHVAFVFMPLILYAIYKLNRSLIKDKLRNHYFKLIFAGLSFAGLILSHNAISLLFTPFIVFYIIYLFYEHKSKTKLILSFISLFLGFLYSFFFWLPAFLEGKYTLRDIVTAGEYIHHFIKPQSLIFGPWSFGGSGFFSTQIGVIHLLLVILSVIILFRFFKKTEKQKYLFLGTLVFLSVSIFLMFRESNFIWVKLTTFQKLQFPWRFLTIVVFCSSLIGGIFISKLNSKYKNLIATILVLLTIVLTFNYWHAREYKQIPDDFLNKIYNGTTDTGESAPIWSIRFMEKNPSDEIEIIDGKAKVVKVTRSSAYHEYLVDAEDKTRIRENTLYFPGWKIYDNQKMVADVQFQDPKNRGLLTFYVEPGVHNIIVKFEDTKLRKIANYITLTAIFLTLFPLMIYLNPVLTKKLKW